MQYIFLVTILLLFLYAVFSAKSQLAEDNKSKAYTSVTGLMSFAILISILFSIAISLRADIPSSSNHGGFVYIIGPTIIGIVVLSFYLLALEYRPHQKFNLGLLAIFIILCGGVYYFVN